MRRERAGAVLAALALTALAILAAGCGSPSEEARIRGLLKRAAALAEARELDALRGLFAPDYEDFQGRGVDDTLRLVSGHLDRYRAVVIHLLGARVGGVDPEGRASVEFEVSLSHGAAEVLRKLIRLSGEYYRFLADVRKDGDGQWRFVSAEWSSIGLTDLLPESFEILKELFPDISRMP